jgi:hypothetical protein
MIYMSMVLVELFKKRIADVAQIEKCEEFWLSKCVLDFDFNDCMAACLPLAIHYRQSRQ